MKSADSAARILSIRVCGEGSYAVWPEAREFVIIQDEVAMKAGSEDGEDRQPVPDAAVDRILNVPAAESASRATTDQILRRLTAGMKPVRPLAPDFVLFAALSAIYVAGVFWGALRLGASCIVGTALPQPGALLGSIAVAASLMAWSLVRQMTPGSRQFVSPGVLLTYVLLSLTLVVVTRFPVQSEPDFWQRSWCCISAGTPVGVVVALPVWLVLRRGAILSVKTAGATAGLFAGLAGAGSLQMRCANQDASHILLSHLSLAELGAVGGLLTGYVVEAFGSRRASTRSAK